VTRTRAVFVMRDGRAQSARRRQALPNPCKAEGLAEYAELARAVDPRIQTRCLSHPADAHAADSWRAWEFTLPVTQPAT
jgi:hypothetical protein